MLQKASTLHVDTVCMDLEDAVAHNQKEAARGFVVDALNSWKEARAERLVRINPIGSGLELADIESILAARILPDGLVVPKVESAAQLEWVDAQLVRILGADRAKDLILIALIESVEGMINIGEISRASKRLRAFIFGADDYRASVGAIKTRSNHEVSHARNIVLMHAKARGLDAIDLVQTDFSDLSIIEREAREGFELGYTGKQIIHPKQIAPVQKSFSPDPASVEWATKVVAEAEKQASQGVGAFTVDGQMVDRPLILKAQQIVGRAKQCAESDKPAAAGAANSA